MALTPTQYGLVVASLGLASFISGILAELKKPAAGEAISGRGVMICKYPSDPSVVLGIISTTLLLAATVAGYLSLFYPYKGKSVPKAAIFSSILCFSYITVALVASIFAAIFLIWPTVEGQIHHTSVESECPTAKTGLLGGGAFASLNSSLFWLLSLMLVLNAREDYFDEEETHLDI